MVQKILFLLFVTVIGLPLTTTGQDRNVVWVHGFNGTSADWANFSNQFSSTRRINPNFTPVTYNSSNGLGTFRNGINSVNAGRLGTAPTQRSIIVGHSMGGAAARRLDFTTDVGGIVTVGAPLDGAGIATAVNNGAATAEIENGVNQVARGPISTLSLIVSVLGIRVTDVIEALIANGIIASNPLAFTPAAFGPASVNDLQLGGGGITTDMNNPPTARPKISVFGNLSSPVHWKMAADALRFSGQSILGQTNVDIPTAASNAEDIYYTFFVVHTGVAVAATVGGFFQPWLWWIAAIEYWKANEWHAGYDWLRDSERIWNVVIAANLPSVQSQCFSYTQFVCSYSNNANFTNPSCWQPVTRCVSTVLTGQSDGFIAAGSQAGFNSPSWAGAALVEAFDVSHFQELDVNNAEMQRRFAQIWNGDHGGYFLTLPR
jgi:pimeloyl-ACP methyl ester carboxylesterase